MMDVEQQQKRRYCRDHVQYRTATPMQIHLGIDSITRALPSVPVILQLAALQRKPEDRLKMAKTLTPRCWA